MAESIKEGTLKRWLKREEFPGRRWSGDTDAVIEIGDYVEQDEEIATIETDKVLNPSN